MVRNALTILPEMMQDFQCVSNHFWMLRIVHKIKIWIHTILNFDWTKFFSGNCDKKL